MAWRETCVIPGRKTNTSGDIMATSNLNNHRKTQRDAAPGPLAGKFAAGHWIHAMVTDDTDKQRKTAKRKLKKDLPDDDSGS